MQHPRTAIISLTLPLLLGSLPAAAGLLTVDSVSRSYSGTARTSDNTNNTVTVPLSESASGLGALAPKVVTSNAGAGSGVATAEGIAASVSLTDLGSESYNLGFATASSATHRNGSFVFLPSSGSADATIAFLGQIDLTGSAADATLAFTSVFNESGSANSGTLVISSDLDGELLNSAVDALADSWDLSASAGALVTLSVDMNSHSVKGGPTTPFVTERDSDSQDLSLGLQIAVAQAPSPGSLWLLLGALLPLVSYAPRRAA